MAFPTCDSWDCVNALASVAAAVGTVGAFIGALWLATADKRARVSIKNHMLLSGPPIVVGPSGTAQISSDDMDRFFEAQLVNVSHVPVTINSCGWLVRLNRRQHLLLWSNQSAKPFVKRLQSTIPIRLEYGQEATFVFDTFTLPEPTHELHGLQRKWLAYLRTRTLRFEVRTSVGKSVRVPADPDIKNEIWKEYCRRYYNGSESVWG